VGAAIKESCESINDKLTGNLGDAIKNTSIGDCRLFRPLAENFSQRILGLLQHNRHFSEVPPAAVNFRFRRKSGPP
jgi:hypothetical protein